MAIIIWLIGIWMSLTKNPIKPMIKKPWPVARAIRVKSIDENKRKEDEYVVEAYGNRFCISDESWALPFISGFLHLRTKKTDSR